MLILSQHGVPPMYRLGVGLRWGFINPEQHNFSEEDYATLLVIDPTNDFWSNDDVSKELDKIELSVVFHLGSQYGQHFPKALSEQNALRFRLEWGVSSGESP